MPCALCLVPVSIVAGAQMRQHRTHRAKSGLKDCHQIFMHARVPSPCPQVDFAWPLIHKRTLVTGSNYILSLGQTGRLMLGVVRLTRPVSDITHGSQIVSCFVIHLNALELPSAPYQVYKHSQRTFGARSNEDDQRHIPREKTQT